LTPDHGQAASDGQLASYEDRRRALRDQWISEVGEVIRSFPPITFGLVAGGFESSEFLAEAVACHQKGLFLAALTCAHATCERKLAGRSPIVATIHRAGGNVGGSAA